MSRNYEPEFETIYDPVTIPGVNVVDYAKYKALDDEGNLYVWDKYTGGYQEISDNPEGAVNTTENEYIVEPLVVHSNGWSAIQAGY